MLRARVALSVGLRGAHANPIGAKDHLGALRETGGHLVASAQRPLLADLGRFDRAQLQRGRLIWDGGLQFRHVVGGLRAADFLVAVEEQDFRGLVHVLEGVCPLSNALSGQTPFWSQFH